MRGFTLIELLVAMLLGMVITGALFRLLEPAQQIIGPQLEAADLQQRVRVGVEAMRGDLLMAGADRTDGLSSPFMQVTPAVLPYRHGASGDDSSGQHPAAGARAEFASDAHANRGPGNRARPGEAAKFCSGPNGSSGDDARAGEAASSRSRAIFRSRADKQSDDQR